MDQINRKVPAEIKEHFIDLWSSTLDPQTISLQVDHYETVRRSIKKKSVHRNNTKIKYLESNKWAEMNSGHKSREESNWRVKSE